MIGPVVMGTATTSPILLIGQAPGDKEGAAGRPFAWTAGKTLFKWFESIGLSEAQFRSRIYMAAVCRCFPGKNPKGGDRVPSKVEIANCKRWLEHEIEILQPKLLLPVGKLAINQFIEFNKLVDVIGRQLPFNLQRGDTDLIPLPHPSGASTWHRTEPGKSLLEQALNLIQHHPAWQQLSNSYSTSTKPGKLTPY
jgi:uracil-DNA glycosylase